MRSLLPPSPVECQTEPILVVEVSTISVAPPQQPERTRDAQPGQASHDPGTANPTRTPDPQNSPVSSVDQVDDREKEPAPSIAVGPEEKHLTPEPKTFDVPKEKSDREPASQVIPEQMEYDGEKRGPKTKFYQRIAMLERMRNGDTSDWDLLEPEMQRYYKREYPEYFGRDSKTKREKREQNRIEATRIRHERLQREYRRSTTLLPE